jgi:hypothetical protein
MLYEEFNKISGKTVDTKMYFDEIDPTYMTFDWMTKDEIVTMYWGEKKGAYALWLEGNQLYKEKEALKSAWPLGDEYKAVWQKKADAYRAKVERMMAKKN